MRTAQKKEEPIFLLGASFLYAGGYTILYDFF